MSCTRHLSLLAVLCLFATASCRAPEPFLEPAPDDPLDGHSSYQDAGVTTAMDLGPGQKSLLTGYSEERKRSAQLEKDIELLQQENRTLSAKLQNEGSDLERERAQHAQTRSALQELTLKHRALESQLLSLSIEKAKLEQESLLSRISNLRQSLEELSPNTVEPAVPAGGRR